MSFDADKLWERIGELFAEDDGALYDVRLVGLSKASVPRLVGHLQKIAPSFHGAVWDRTLDKEGDLRDLAQAALQVVEERFDEFHVSLTGIQMNGVSIPELGLWVASDELTFVYRPGKDWSAAVLQAFFELLYQLNLIEHRLTVDLAPYVAQEGKDEFSKAYAWYCVNRGSDSKKV